MTNPKLPLNNTTNKTKRPALQSIIFGVIGILGLAVSAVLVYASGLIPFLILLTGLIAIPLVFIAFILGIFGVVYGVRAIQLPDVLAWIATLINSVVLLIILITVLVPLLSSVIGTIAMAIHS